MAQFLEITARIPLTGSAMEDAAIVASMSGAVEELTRSVKAKGGTVATKVARTVERAPKAPPVALVTAAE